MAGTYNFKLQIQRDLVQVTTTDIGQDLTFTPPIGAPVTVSGYASKHSIVVNELGFVSVNTKKVSITVMESVLIAAGYVTRNSDGSLMTFTRHLITFTDVSGLTVTYIVQESDRLADESLGMLKFTLGVYQPRVTPTRTIYGWKVYKVNVLVVAVVNPLNVQVLGNGDTIPAEYVLNSDGTLTVPYLISVPGIEVLTPFLRNNNSIGNMPYDGVTGTFDGVPVRVVFKIGDVISFNASLPIYILP